MPRKTMCKPDKKKPKWFIGRRCGGKHSICVCSWWVWVLSFACECPPYVMDDVHGHGRSLTSDFCTYIYSSNTSCQICLETKIMWSLHSRMWYKTYAMLAMSSGVLIIEHIWFRCVGAQIACDGGRNSLINRPNIKCENPFPCVCGVCVFSVGWQIGLINSR